MHLSKNFMPFVLFFKEKKDAVLQNNFVTNWYVQGHIPGEVKEVKCQDPKQCQEIYSQVPSEDKSQVTHVHIWATTPISRLTCPSQVLHQDWQVNPGSCLNPTKVKCKAPVSQKTQIDAIIVMSQVKTSKV